MMDKTDTPRSRPSNPRGRQAPSSQDKIQAIHRISNKIVEEVSKVIVGKREVLEKVMVAFLASGSHVLFEDMPGLGKSVMCESFAAASGCDFHRVQFTPDLLPGDITGSSVFNQKDEEFVFHPGPIFTNILLADEINRASPKTQSALLEAMAEKQVSVEGQTYKLEQPFTVFATQNPVEQEGTYPLPEAQMDRFAMKLSMGYPSESDEAEILRRRVDRGKDDHDVQRVSDAKTVAGMQRAVEKVHVDEEMFTYISRIITATREHPALRAGSSPRGSLAILKLARAYAAMQGRAYITPDDVKAFGAPVLAHRIILTPEAKLDSVTGADVVEEILEDVPIPKV